VAGVEEYEDIEKPGAMDEQKGKSGEEGQR